MRIRIGVFIRLKARLSKCYPMAFEEFMDWISDETVCVIHPEWIRWGNSRCDALQYGWVLEMIVDIAKSVAVEVKYSHGCQFRSFLHAPLHEERMISTQNLRTGTTICALANLTG